MDATTKQKTLSGVLVALMVGSVFLAAVPTASAQAPNFTDAPEAVVDDSVSHSETLTGTSGTAYPVTVNNITHGSLEFNKSYDLTFTNLNGTATTDQWYLYGPGAGTPGTVFTPAKDANGQGVNPRTAGDDTAHLGKYNITFPNVQLNQVGVWRANRSTGDADSHAVYFVVSPVTNLVVGLSQSSFPVTDSQVSFTITVSPLAAGEVAGLRGTGIPTGTTVSGPTGAYVFAGPLSEAGTFTITASRSINGDDLPEYSGSASYTVTAVSLLHSLVSSTNVRSGFMGETVWNITYPTGNAVFGPSAPTRLVSYNLSVTGPNAFTAYANMTCDGSFSATPTERNQTAGGSCTAHSDAGVITWSYNSNGNWTFSPNSTWGSGTYNFVLNANTAGTAGSVPEFTAAWSFTPPTPADINLDLNVASTGTTVTAFTVQPPGTSTTPSTGPAGSYTLNLTVTGTTQSSHPTSGAPDSFGAANVTISGDVILLGTAFSGYDPATGIATLTGIVPTKAGGSVTFAVTWKGKTASVVVPITQGAAMVADKTQLVVDQAVSVEFTVFDQNENTIPDATITVFEKGTAANSASELTGYAQLKGNGTVGYGRLGKYTLTVTPTTISRFVAVATIGQGAPGPEGTRYAYVELTVVPAHDITVTLNRTAAMASDPTSYSLNATIGNGAALGSNPQIYLLNAKQYEDLTRNGTLLASGQSTGAPTAISAPAFVFPGSSDIRGYNFTAALAPGTYRVYVCGNVNGAPAPAVSCSDARHDNNQSVPNITVSSFAATFSPDRIADNPNIQNNQSINVTVKDTAGNPWYGTLTIDTASSAGVLGFTNRSSGSPMSTFSLPIVNGTGAFLATGVGQGAVNFRFDPDPAGVSVGPATASSLVTGALTVVGPNVQVTPERFPLGVAQTLVITVKALDGTALPNLSVKVCGTPIGGNDTNPECTGSVTTNADGMALVGVNPSSTGNLTLFVNNVATPTKVIVFAGLVITHTPTAPQAGDTVTITVKDTAGTPQAGVNVTYTLPNASARSQNADSNGQIVIASIPVGNTTVTASKPLFDVATIVIRVGNQTAPSQQARFELSDLELPDDAVVGQQTFASVTLSNTGTASGSATVTLLVDGRPAGQQTWTVDAGDDLPLDFGFTPTRAGTFEVEVRVTNGESITGTVTITTPVVTTPVTSTPVTSTPVTSTPVTSTPVTSTPTTTTTTTTTTTSPTPTATPEPEVPGFEVVGLLAALGVALLVLRRRN